MDCRYRPGPGGARQTDGIEWTGTTTDNPAQGPGDSKEQRLVGLIVGVREFEQSPRGALDADTKIPVTGEAVKFGEVIDAGQ